MLPSFSTEEDENDDDDDDDDDNENEEDNNDDADDKEEEEVDFPISRKPRYSETETDNSGWKTTMNPDCH